MLTGERGLDVPGAGGYHSAVKFRHGDARRRLHIDRGGRAFLPADRMRHIRWEEALSRAKAKRDGVADPVVTHHFCSCGSIECQGVPWVRGKDEGAR